MTYNFNLPSMDYTKAEKDMFRHIFWYRLRKRLWRWFKISTTLAILGLTVMLCYLLVVYFYFAV